MARLSLKPLVGAVLVSLCAMPAYALNLLEAYQAAKQNDPTYRAAMAEHQAGQKNDELAVAGLLPQVSASLYRGKTVGVRLQPGFTGRITQSDLDYDSKNYGIQLRQSLFDWRKVSEFRQGRARVSYSDAVFAAKSNELAIRVAGAYFDTLLAQNTLSLLDARVRAYEEQLVRAENLYRAGDGTVTDMDEARARRDIAIAQRYEAQDRLKVALRSLQELTGAVPDALHILGDEFPLSVPVPATLEEWVDVARQNSPDIRAGEHALEIAAREVDKARAGHLPTVDMIGSLSKTVSDTVSTLNQENRTRSIGVQVSIPIFSGGYSWALSDQTLAKREQARQELEAARHRVELDITRYFTASLSGVSKVRGYEQAVKSSERALHSTKMGFTAGLRTNVDILNAEEQLFQARRDLAEARYQYLVSTLRLRASAGVLVEDDIARLNGFLAGATAAKAETTAPAATVTKADKKS